MNGAQMISTEPSQQIQQGRILNIRKILNKTDQLESCDNVTIFLAVVGRLFGQFLDVSQHFADVVFWDMSQVVLFLNFNAINELNLLS